jgi:ribonucleoside-diphosphate reductase alpha chain
MSVIRDAGYAASIDLAKEKGAFPALQRNLYLDSAFIGRLPASLRARINAEGLRNSHLLAIAPTGSISLLAGGVSTGVEPIFASLQRRTIHDERGVPQPVELADLALSLWRFQKPAQESLPPGFITAWDLPLSAHIDMQAALQPFVDQAISKTWNVSPDCEFEEFDRALRYACTRGLKGFAVFRPGRAREGVLSAAPMRSCLDEATPCE